jgi:hypothetical protein
MRGNGTFQTRERIVNHKNVVGIHAQVGKQRARVSARR